MPFSVSLPVSAFNAASRSRPDQPARSPAPAPSAPRSPAPSTRARRRQDTRAATRTSAHAADAASGESGIPAAAMKGLCSLRPSGAGSRPLRVRFPVIGVQAVSQSQLRLRRARLREAGGLSSCGLSVGWWGSGRLFPSPGPGGNQTSAGSATGGDAGSAIARCCLRRLHSRQKPGRASPATRESTGVP
jgi:hypothetical protein